MKKNKEIKTIQKSLARLTQIIHTIHQKDFEMHKTGIIYRCEVYQKKCKYKLENIFEQLNRLVEEEKKERIVETLKKEQEIVRTEYLKSVRYQPPIRTLEKDLWVVACYQPLVYCNKAIEVVEKAIQENRTFRKELKKETDISIKIILEMQLEFRETMREERVKKRNGYIDQNYIRDAARI